MDMKELWERACSILRLDMNSITYMTFIDNNLFPVSLEGDKLTLRIAMGQLKAAVTSRYQNLIENALKQVAGTPIHAAILTRGELTDPAPAAPASRSVALNDQYTFDTFVVGNSNRFAHAAAVAVADAPAEIYNPLFIYGGVGLGKTHLMHAIGHHMLTQYPKKRVLYVTSETFTNDLITAIQQGRNMEFRERYRSVDVLMVDDIQFIAGRDSTQEEFFNTFNDLHTAGKQIILTSDRPPKDISRLEERLRSRFGWGLIADIQKPDLETRIAILRAKAKSEHMDVPNDVLELIAANIDSNIRELEGSLNNLQAFARVAHMPITVDLCKAALHDVFDHRKKRVITAEVVMRTACEYFQVDTNEMLGPTRRREVTVPRQIAMYLTRELTALSLSQIGTAFGNRDHTTVLHSCSQVAEGLEKDPALASQVNDVRQMITEG